MSYVDYTSYVDYMNYVSYISYVDHMSYIVLYELLKFTWNHLKLVELF